MYYSARAHWNSNSAVYEKVDNIKPSIISFQSGVQRDKQICPWKSENRKKKRKSEVKINIIIELNCLLTIYKYTYCVKKKMFAYVMCV